MYYFLLKVFLPAINFLYYKLPLFYLIFYYSCKYFFEYKTVKFVNNWLFDGDIAVDVGANVGFYTNIFRNKIGGNGSVYAFEPESNNFSYLKKQFLSFKNINLYKTAVGDKNERIKLYLSSVHNTDHHTFAIGEKRKYKLIKSISLDKVISKNPNINLLKVDVQGYDYYVLKGAKNLISRSTRIAIIGEMWPYAMYRSGIMPSKYVELIRSLGFKFVRTDSKAIEEIDGKINSPRYYLDFIAVKA